MRVCLGVECGHDLLLAGHPWSLHVQVRIDFIFLYNNHKFIKGENHLKGNSIMHITC